MQRYLLCETEVKIDSMLFLGAPWYTWISKLQGEGGGGWYL